MIIFGTKAGHCGSVKTQGFCTECENTEHLIHVLQKYFHIFWIPTIPIWQRRSYGMHALSQSY